MEETIEKKKTEKQEKSKGRLYYGKVAIVGPSGTGKSYLTKTANRDTTGYINVERKPLPYKLEPFKYEGRPKTWVGFMKNFQDYIDSPDVKQIIIDSQTEAFNVLNNEMKKMFSGWDVAKNYNSRVWEYLTLLKNAEKDIIVMSHDERLKSVDADSVRRMFVHNKEYEGKIEEHYTIVLYACSRLKEDKPQWFLKTFDSDTTAKVPENLFDGKMEIPNSADFIFSALENYYK